MKCRSLTTDDINLRRWYNDNQTRWNASLKGCSFISVQKWFPGLVDVLSPVQLATMMLELQRKYHETIKRLEAYGKEDSSGLV